MVRFEDLKQHFEEVIHKLEAALDLQANQQLKMPTLTDRSISPRKGIIGDWQTHFTREDLEFFDEKASDLMRTLGYPTTGLVEPCGSAGRDPESQGMRFEISASKSTNLLWFRTDAIGDNVLAAGMIPFIKAEFGPGKLTVVCREHIADIYHVCPLVDEIISYDRTRAYQDEHYRSNLVEKIQNTNADIALNSVYSRGPLNDFLTASSGAPERIAHNGNFSNIDQGLHEKNNQFYTKLIAGQGNHRLELERHRDFLNGLGIEVRPLQPVIWLTREDEQFASDFFKAHQLIPEKTIALFAGAQNGIRLYQHYGTALSSVCKQNDFSVIALGSQADYRINQHNLDAIQTATYNLSGLTTIRQSAALLKYCRLAVGAETGLAHIACAVDTPNVILLGGGHFGRFMPYTHLTSVVCLPQDCFGCDWRCPFDKPLCLNNTQPEVIAEALMHSLHANSGPIHIFVSPAENTADSNVSDRNTLLRQWLNIEKFEIVETGTVNACRSQFKGPESGRSVYTQHSDRARGVAS